MTSLAEALSSGTSSPVSIVDIISDAIKGILWDKKSYTDGYILSRIVKSALQYGISYDQLQAKSLDDAKTFQNYEYIKYNDQHIKNCNLTYFRSSFIICIDDSKRIWAIFRQRIKNDILTNDAVNLLSCLGAVYVYFSKNYWDIISKFPDNVIQILNSYVGHKTEFVRNITHFPMYMKGIKNTNDTQIPNPFNMMGWNVEYIDTYYTDLENLPPNTKTLIVTHSSDKKKKNINLSLFPYGIKNITLNLLFNESFTIFPPTVENITIERLYTQLNGFPMNLKSLTINYVHNPCICLNEQEENYWYPQNITSDCLYVGEFPCSNCDNILLKSYKYTFSNIVFPDGFTTLTLNYTNSYTILKYITTIPISFNTVVMTNYHFVMEYPNEKYSDIAETIIKFKERFPTVDITFME